jgi:hypothetical protein
LDGVLKPLIFLTNCSEAARISSSLAGGSKLKSVRMFLHISLCLQSAYSAIELLRLLHVVHGKTTEYNTLLQHRLAPSLDSVGGNASRLVGSLASQLTRTRVWVRQGPTFLDLFSSMIRKVEMVLTQLLKDIHAFPPQNCFYPIPRPKALIVLMNYKIY